MTESLDAFGASLEFFNEDAFEWLVQRFHNHEPFDGSFHRYMRLMVKNASRKGLFSFQIDPVRLRALVEHLVEEEIFQCDKIKFIYMYRRDILAQAISFLEAMKSNIWHQFEDKNDDVNVTLDDAEITKFIINLLNNENFAHAFLDKYASQPLSITYEDIACNSYAVLKLFLMHHGIAIDNEKLCALQFGKTRKMTRNSTNTNWARYLQNSKCISEILTMRMAQDKNHTVKAQAILRQEAMQAS
jgi:LPS sulfotransferase NodH